MVACCVKFSNYYNHNERTEPKWTMSTNLFTCRHVNRCNWNCVDNNNIERREERRKNEGKHFNFTIGLDADFTVHVETDLQRRSRRTERHKTCTTIWIFLRYGVYIHHAYPIIHVKRFFECLIHRFPMY